MEPLKTGRKILVWFCPNLTDNESSSHITKCARKLVISTFATVFCGIVLLNTVTFVNHAKINVEEFFIVFYQFSITLNAICGFITIFLLGNKLSRIFDGLSSICSKCKTINSNTFSVIFNMRLYLLSIFFLFVVFGSIKLIGGNWRSE